MTAHTRRRLVWGVLLAASLTGLPIVPIGMWVDRAWYAKSWDRHIVAKPFARVVLALPAGRDSNANTHLPALSSD